MLESKQLTQGESPARFSGLPTFGNYRLWDDSSISNITGFNSFFGRVPSGMGQRASQCLS
jgi:hypothetical protein